jgi:hypothetical protein
VSEKCECQQKFNDLLKPCGFRLATAIQVTKKMHLIPRLMLRLEKLDGTKRAKEPVVAATFCPFCGVKLPCAQED